MSTVALLIVAIFRSQTSNAYQEFVCCSCCAGHAAELRTADVASMGLMTTAATGAAATKYKIVSQTRAAAATASRAVGLAAAAAAADGGVRQERAGQATAAAASRDLRQARLWGEAAAAVTAGRGTDEQAGTTSAVAATSGSGRARRTALTAKGASGTSRNGQDSLAPATWVCDMRHIRPQGQEAAAGAQGDALVGTHAESHRTKVVHLDAPGLCGGIAVPGSKFAGAPSAHFKAIYTL